ncbi:hypothetical protein MMC22_010825 [Lobaria immixta]|nr:hypothetical protein [Lobaria immixta]
MSFAVMGEECPTVGLAGGYTQGGGHSALASKYGLAADQTLEWEVVDGCEQFLRASRTENQNLYWALSGGGGGTYGVVWSLTSKVHKEIPVSAANLTFTNQGVSAERFYTAVGAYHESLALIVDAGAMSMIRLRQKLMRDRGISAFRRFACDSYFRQPIAKRLSPASPILNGLSGKRVSLEDFSAGQGSGSFGVQLGWVHGIGLFLRRRSRSMYIDAIPFTVPSSSPS